MLLVSCANRPPGVPSIGEGFVAFESPRDFDAPGQIYRVDKEGAIYRVGQIQVQPRSGTEKTKSIRTSASWSLDTALKYSGASLGGLSPEASAQFSQERAVTLESADVLREYIEDTDRPEAKVADLLSNVTYRPDNKYYLIRETAATSKLNVVGSRKALGNTKIQAELEKVIAGHAAFNYNNEASFSLVATFPKPMRVWYKAELLKPQMTMGAGPKAVPAFALVDPAKDPSVKPLRLPKRKAATKP